MENSAQYPSIPVIEPAGLRFSEPPGELVHANGHYEKRFSELDGLYADAEAYLAMLPTLADTTVYSVTDYKPSSDAGDLIVGVTRMNPGRVGDEYFMTRGHIHAIPNRPEMYFGQTGNGLMLMEAPDGEIRTIPLNAGAICYVPPYWIHRTVNIGEAEFVMAFCYPADSGQDYKIIETSRGMRKRVFSDGANGWRLVDNSDYRPRSFEDIRRLAASAR